MGNRTESNRQTPGRRAAAWALLAAAVIEVIAPAVVFGASGSTPGAGGPELLINPAGWAFAIWGVIYGLAIAQAVGVLRQGADAVSRRLQIDLIALYLLGALWIVMSTTDSSVATAVALLLMLVAAVDAVLTVARESIAPRWLSRLTRASVGLYAGWVTAAFFLNLGAALVDVDVLGAGELTWQVVLLVVAALTLLALAVLTRGIVTYALAGIWALVGIVATAQSAGTSEITVVAVASIVLLVVATLALRVTEHRSAHPAAA